MCGKAELKAENSFDNSKDSSGVFGWLWGFDRAVGSSGVLSLCFSLICATDISRVVYSVCSNCWLGKVNSN